VLVNGATVKSRIMPVKKGQKKPEYTQEERADIVERVCQLYESQNATLESCCAQIGISYDSFYLWCVQFQDFKERYKKAKTAAGEHFFENVLVPKAMTATELLLMEREIEDQKEEPLAWQGLKTGDTRIIKTRSKVQPNATTAIFIMKGAFPETFKDRTDVTTKGESLNEETWFMKLPLEKRLKILEIANENGG
jgi:transposase-like protein